MTIIAAEMETIVARNSHAVMIMGAETVTITVQETVSEAIAVDLATKIEMAVSNQTDIVALTIAEVMDRRVDLVLARLPTNLEDMAHARRMVQALEDSPEEV